MKGLPVDTQIDFEAGHLTTTPHSGIKWNTLDFADPTASHRKIIRVSCPTVLLYNRNRTVNLL